MRVPRTPAVKNAARFAPPAAATMMGAGQRSGAVSSQPLALVQRATAALKSERLAVCVLVRTTWESPRKVPAKPRIRTNARTSGALNRTDQWVRYVRRGTHRPRVKGSREDR